MSRLGDRALFSQLQFPGSRIPVRPIALGAEEFQGQSDSLINSSTGIGDHRHGQTELKKAE